MTAHEAIAAVYMMVERMFWRMDKNGMFNGQLPTRSAIVDQFQALDEFCAALKGPPLKSASGEPVKVDAEAGARVSAIAKLNSAVEQLDGADRGQWEAGKLIAQAIEILEAQPNDRESNDRFEKLVRRIAEWSDDELANVDARQTRHIAQVVIEGADPEYPSFDQVPGADGIVCETREESEANEIARAVRDAVEHGVLAGMQGIKTAIDGPTPEEQHARFEQILAEDPVPSTAVKAALERLEYMAKHIGPTWGLDLRGIAGYLDRLAVERTDLANKLQEATRWERNPLRRPTIERVNEIAANLRNPDNREYAHIVGAGVIAETLESMAAELIAQDRTIHEATEAKGKAIAERDALAQQAELAAETIDTLRKDTRAIQENTAKYRNDSAVERDSAIERANVAETREKRWKAVLAQIARPPANVERIYDITPDTRTAQQAAEIALWESEVEGNAIRFVAELATMTEIEAEFVDGHELAQIARLLQVPGTPPTLPRLYSEEDRERAMLEVATWTDRTSGAHSSRRERFAELVDVVAEALGMRRAGK